MALFENYNEFPDTIQEYLNYKAVIQGCSRKTVDEYALDLKNFFKHYMVSKAFGKVDTEAVNNAIIGRLTLEEIKSVSSMDIYSYLMYVTNERSNSSASKARKLSAIKGFYKFLVSKKHYLESSPAENIESPKLKKALPKYLSLEESIELLNTIANDSESNNRTRDYAIVTLFLNCGMRLSELVGISLRDIDRELRSILITGKGNKQRIVYLNDACKSALGQYINERGTSANLGDALFLSNRNQRISVKTVQHIVYKYLDMAGLDSKNYSVHKLRHTAATLMYQSGKVDIRVLKDILGHEQLNTTQIYTHVSDENMEKAMNYNPLSDIKRSKKED